MVYFYVHITHNDIVHLQKNLRDDSFCLLQTEKDSDTYYGVVTESAYHSLLHTLSAETLEQLEYMSEEEFRTIVKQEKVASHVGMFSLCESS